MQIRTKKLFPFLSKMRQIKKTTMKTFRRTVEFSFGMQIFHF